MPEVLSCGLLVDLAWLRKALGPPNMQRFASCGHIVEPRQNDMTPFNRFPFGIFLLRRRDVCGRNGGRSNKSIFILGFFFSQVCDSSGLSGHGLNPHITKMTMRITRMNDSIRTL